MGQTNLRSRAVVDSYFTVFVAVLLVVALLGGLATYDAYGQSETRTDVVTSNVSSWSATGQFTHQARVLNGSKAFAEGSVLKNRSVYFLTASPRLNGTFTYNYTASGNGSVMASGLLKLVVRSVGGSEDQRVEYWRFEERLVRSSARLSPGERLRLDMSRNMSTVRQEIQRTAEQLGATLGSRVATFVATVELDGRRNGKPVDRTRRYRLPVRIGEALVRVNGTGPTTESGRETAQRERVVAVDPGALPAVGGPLASVAGLVGLFGLVIGRYSGWTEVSDTERAYLEYRTDRQEFDGWITEVQGLGNRAAEVETRFRTTALSGLVDLAIDMDRRVIETDGHESYLVFDGDICYSYEPPTLGHSDSSDGDPFTPADETTVTADGQRAGTDEDPFEAIGPQKEIDAGGPDDDGESGSDPDVSFVKRLQQRAQTDVNSDDSDDDSDEDAGVDSDGEGG